MTRRILMMLAVLLVAVVAGAVAQESGAAAKEPSKVPPSTNPANKVIYPSKGQDAEQQMKDQLDSYNWATEQTKWDPYEAYDVLVQKGYAAAQTAEEAQGGLVGGAARGALAGLAIGAIAGDAGKGAAIGATAGGLAGGARSRRKMDSAQSQADQAIQEYQSALDVWVRNWTASMEGRGYSVS